MDDAPVINEETLTPLRVTYGVSALAIAAATFFLTLSARVDTVDAKVRNNEESFLELKRDRAESMKLWQEDRLQNAKFQSEVMTKLNRIEKLKP